MRLFYLIIFLLSIISCQPEGRVYVEHEHLSPDVEWLQQDFKEFTIPIDEINKPYKFSIAYRYAYGYQFNELKVLLIEESPSGKVTEYNYSIAVKDEQGEYMGDAGYDIWDIEKVVDEQKIFSEKGNYKYTLSHNMPQDPLYFAMEIGLMLDETK